MNDRIDDKDVQINGYGIIKKDWNNEAGGVAVLLQGPLKRFSHC